MGEFTPPDLDEIVGCLSIFLITSLWAAVLIGIVIKLLKFFLRL